MAERIRNPDFLGGNRRVFPVGLVDTTISKDGFAFAFVDFEIAGRRPTMAEQATSFGPKDGSGGVFAGGRHFEERGGGLRARLARGLDLWAEMPAKSSGSDAKNNGNLGLGDAQAAHPSDSGAVFPGKVKSGTADDFEGARFGDAGVGRRVHIQQDKIWGVRVGWKKRHKLLIAKERFF